MNWNCVLRFWTKILTLKDTFLVWSWIVCKKTLPFVFICVVCFCTHRMWRERERERERERLLFFEVRKEEVFVVSVLDKVLEIEIKILSIILLLCLLGFRSPFYLILSYYNSLTHSTYLINHLSIFISLSVSTFWFFFLILI